LNHQAQRSWDKLRLLLPVAYAAAIFYGGVTRIGELPHTRFIASDKLLHAGAFLGLEVLVEWALLGRDPRIRRFTAVASAIGVGAALELVQAGLPYRSADIWDLVADSVGAFMGAIGVALLTRLHSKQAGGEPS
jgi:VanZ family protein